MTRAENFISVLFSKNPTMQKLTYKVISSSQINRTKPIPLLPEQLELMPGKAHTQSWLQSTRQWLALMGFGSTTTQVQMQSDQIRWRNCWHRRAWSACSRPSRDLGVIYLKIKGAKVVFQWLRVFTWKSLSVSIQANCKAWRSLGKGTRLLLKIQACSNRQEITTSHREGQMPFSHPDPALFVFLSSTWAPWGRETAQGVFPS